MLRQWFGSFTKEELVNMLATIMYTGIPPVIPDAALIKEVKVSRGRGRPKGSTVVGLTSNLLKVLGKYYPMPAEELNLSIIAKEMNVAVSTLVRYREHVEYLPPYLQSYFLDIPNVHIAPRFPLIWRAVLDIHNHMLIAAEPGRIIPIYALHARLWGAKALSISVRTLGDHKLARAEQQELNRVFDPNLLSVFEHAGWPKIQVPSVPGGAGCADGCHIVEAYIHGHVPKTVGGWRELLCMSSKLPKGVVLDTQDKKDFIAPRTLKDVYQQILSPVWNEGEDIIGSPSQPLPTG
jgi:hypothetical protein